MGSNSTNVIVYVKRPVGHRQAGVISTAISALQGVVQAAISVRAPNIFTVDYDPRVIDSQDIQKSVSEQGFPARLVGM